VLRYRSIRLDANGSFFGSGSMVSLPPNPLKSALASDLRQTRPSPLRLEIGGHIVSTF
jgi:hypothetical protein